MASLGRRLFRSDRAAVAPIVALSLFGLIGAGGIAFDYARLAAMDTELQQAADQAALAAATQLDRIEDPDDPTNSSQARAIAAVNGDPETRLALNNTRFATDPKGRQIDFDKEVDGEDPDGKPIKVTVDNILFCSEFDDSVADTQAACTEAEDSSDSRFVIVTTSVRTADYALTPIVAAFAGQSRAAAVAGIESSICNIAPLFVCTEDENFPDEDDIGRGLLLKTGSGNSWAPGNYGLLDFGPGNPGAMDALLGHGLNGCRQTSDVKTEPGNKNVTDAINTRMDVYAGNPATSDPGICGGTKDADGNVIGGAGCPAKNTGKDMFRTETYVVDTAPTETVVPDAPSCGQDMAGFTGTRTVTNFQVSSAVKGYQRDDCHYSNSCTDGNFGDGTWNFAAYMANNHPAVSDTSVVGGTSRYAVYQWELKNNKLAARAVQPVKAPEIEAAKVKGNPVKRWTFVKQCVFHEPIFATTTYPEEKDRRTLPVVAANCDALNGKGGIDAKFRLLRVFDVFLTEPSTSARTSPAQTEEKEIYGEVIGPAQPYETGSGLQYYSRNRPYLVR